jgi:hypothetical protein
MFVYELERESIILNLHSDDVFLEMIRMIRKIKIAMEKFSSIDLCLA